MSNPQVASRVVPGSQVIRLRLRPPVNAYLVLSDSDRILVDTGHAASAPMLLEALRQIAGAEPITAIVVTHGHRDHVGGLAAVAAATRVPVYAHPAEMPFLKGEQAYGDLRRSALYWHSRQKSCSVDGPIRPLEHGAQVGPLTAWHTPGHTPGHLTLWFPPEQTAICGDLLLNVAGRISGPPPFFTADTAANRASVGRLLDLGRVERLCPAHGDPVIGEAAVRIAGYLKRR